MHLSHADVSLECVKSQSVLILVLVHLGGEGVNTLLKLFHLWIGLRHEQLKPDGSYWKGSREKLGILAHALEDLSSVLSIFNDVAKPAKSSCHVVSHVCSVKI